MFVCECFITEAAYMFCLCGTVRLKQASNALELAFELRVTGQRFSKRRSGQGWLGYENHHITICLLFCRLTSSLQIE